MASIDDLLNERKQKAKEHNISEKAKKIAEVFGQKYSFINLFTPESAIPMAKKPALCSLCSYFVHGHEFDDSKIDIKTYIKTYFNSNQQNLVEISLREKIPLSFLWFKIPTYTLKRVYTDENGKMQLFENADEWLGHLEELYQKALEAKK